MIKIVEFFGGIGAYTHSLKKGNIPHKILDYVELDKHAVKSYNAINGTNFVPTDINDVNVNKYDEIDVLVAGWPCQDYSVAGLGKGLDGTRSSLILLTIDKIRQMEIKPKHILLENVKGLLSKKHAQDLEFIKECFEELGYQWNQALLNSKYFNIPQSRERVFIVLTRNDLPQVKINHLEKRNTVDKVLRDVLDFTEPTQTIILSNEIKGKVYFTNQMSQYNGKIIELDLDKLNNQERDKINKVAILGTLENEEFKTNDFGAKDRFYGVKGIHATATATDIARSKIIFKDVSFNQDKSIHGTGGVSPTITTSGTQFKAKIAYGGQPDNVIHYRKISTLECWRLMGFNDEAHNKCKEAGVSNSQLAKQAGNSIVVDVLVEINKELYNG